MKNKSAGKHVAIALIIVVSVLGYAGFQQYKEMADSPIKISAAAKRASRPSIFQPFAAENAAGEARTRAMFPNWKPRKVEPVYTPDDFQHPMLDPKFMKLNRPYTREEKNQILMNLGRPPLRPEEGTDPRLDPANQAPPPEPPKVGFFQGIWNRLSGNTPKETLATRTPATYQPQGSTPQIRFDTPVLKGIFMSKRPAIILNDHTIEKDESIDVEIGGKKVIATCVSIRDASADVVIDGTTNTLYVNHKTE